MGFMDVQWRLVYLQPASAGVSTATTGGFKVSSCGWLSHVYSQVVQRQRSHDFPKSSAFLPKLFPIFLWCSANFPHVLLVFPWFFHGCPMFFQWFSSTKTSQCGPNASSKRCDRCAVNSSGRTWGTSARGAMPHVRCGKIIHKIHCIYIYIDR